MAKLDAAKRRKLPAKDFALVGRRFPIMDKGHAKAALARISEYGSPSEKKEVEAKVRKKYPGMTIKGASSPSQKRAKAKKAHKGRLHKR